jgi:DNA-binding GntR family transcriptional regulator
MNKFSIPRTVKDTLVETLRDEIVRGDFSPGQYLRLEEIAPRFDVSTTPVREALRELEAEGLVTIFPHKGAIVTKLSADELEDIYDIRATLEEMATRLAVPFLTEEILTEMTFLVEQIDIYLDDVATLVKLNHQFHHTLYTASGRSHLCELIRILRYRTQHYLHVFIVESELSHSPKSQGEHQAILEACQRGDSEQAATLMYHHVAQVGRMIIEHERQRNESAAATNETG